MPGVNRALQIWAAPRQRLSRHRRVDPDQGPQVGADQGDPQARRLVALPRRAGVCRYVRILTGRPQTQGPHDLWGQLRAIGLFRETNFYSFRGAFCVMGGWENKEVIRAKNTEALARAMEHNIFQAKKNDWLPNLPRKDQTIRDYKMSADQQAPIQSDGEAVLAGGRVWRHYGRGRHREIRQAGADPDRLHLRRGADRPRTRGARGEPPAQASQADSSRRRSRANAASSTAIGRSCPS